MRVLKRSVLRSEARASKYDNPDVWLEVLSSCTPKSYSKFNQLVKSQADKFKGMSAEDKKRILVAYIDRITDTIPSNIESQLRLFNDRFNPSFDYKGLKAGIDGFKEGSDFSELEKDVGVEVVKRLKDTYGPREVKPWEPEDVIWGMDERYSFSSLTRQLRKDLGERDLEVYQIDCDGSKYEFGDEYANIETVTLNKEGVLKADGSFGRQVAKGVFNIREVDKYMKQWFNATVALK